MLIRKKSPSHPGGILKRLYLNPLNISNKNFASIIGVSKTTVSRLTNEQTGITPNMALKLSRAFETSPELWLNLQRNYDLWHAMNRNTTWKSIQSILILKD